jgi:hypothetical protein
MYTFQRHLVQHISNMDYPLEIEARVYPSESWPSKLSGTHIMTDIAQIHIIIICLCQDHLNDNLMVSELRLRQIKYTTLYIQKANTWPKVSEDILL